MRHFEAILVLRWLFYLSAFAKAYLSKAIQYKAVIAFNHLAFHTFTLYKNFHIIDIKINRRCRI